MEEYWDTVAASVASVDSVEIGAMEKEVVAVSSAEVGDTSEVGVVQEDRRR